MLTRKTLFLIADGVGDWPLAELGGKTPLAAAETPHIDGLARRGMQGLCRTVPLGMPPGSDVANMSLLGFDPSRHHTGRGPIEAAAQGLQLAADDLVWRCNLVTLSDYSPDGLMRDYSSGHIDSAVAAELIARLQAELGDELFTFYAGVQYRHLLVQKAGAKSPEAALNPSPPHDITDKPLSRDFAEYAKSPRLSALMAKASAILARPDNTSKATSIWPWGQGKSLTLPDFRESFGLKGAVVSAVDLVKGLGRAANMAVLDIPGATGLLDTNYEGKVEAALRFLEHGDFVYVHVEAPDECGHGGDIEGKIESVRRFDERIVGPLVAALPEAAFLVTCDHLTPIAVKTHVPDPVPFLFAAPGTNGAGAASFDEATAAASGLVLASGRELLPWVLKTAR